MRIEFNGDSDSNANGYDDADTIPDMRFHCLILFSELLDLQKLFSKTMRMFCNLWPLQVHPKSKKTEHAKRDRTAFTFKCECECLCVFVCASVLVFVK